jgi:poly-beta-1,6-N-acetyl-D-glucosamine synthase
MILLFLSIGLIYAFVFSLYLYGWKKTKEFNPSEKEIVPHVTISVVVACRNEEKQLPFLLDALQAQSTQNFQLILVDDASTDDSIKIMEKSKELFPDIVILKSTGSGKKNALKDGINIASSQIIVTTDSDCIPNSQWIETISDYFSSENPDLLICPVLFREKKSFFNQLQSLEFSSLIASAGGSCGIGRPILCNGANLAVKKEIWLANFASIRSEIASGDDMFLLQSVKKSAGKIRFLKSNHAVVITQANESMGKFIQQRKRWASKSTSYTDVDIIFIAILVMSISTLLLVFGILSVLNLKYLAPTMGVFLLKLLIDFTFLKEVNHFFGRSTNVFYTAVLSFIYPFYVILIGLSSIFHKKKSW